MQYNFEWDPAKAQDNSVKHRVTFEESATVLRDPRMLTPYDGEHSSDEDRWVTMGVSSSGRLLVVCRTFRDETDSSTTIRIFSSRRAGRTEIREYRD